MAEGYNTSDEAPHPAMDELLCEYVDGTMDASVRRVFEEFLAVNPDLAAHAQSLARIRALLCNYRCRLHAPGNFSHRLHRELTTEWMASMAPSKGDAAGRLRHVATLTSLAATITLMSLLVIYPGSDEPPSPYVTADVERVADFPLGAPGEPITFSRDVVYGGIGGFALTAPASALRPPLSATRLDFHGSQWGVEP
jgi:hypothetical protein